MKNTQTEPQAKAAHTPGPWGTFRDLANAAKDQIAIYAADGTKVACIEKWTGLMESAESESNARLIASAPELLAALERAEAALWILATSGNADAVSIHTDARAAISAAKGAQ